MKMGVKFHVTLCATVVKEDSNSQMNQQRAQGYQVQHCCGRGESQLARQRNAMRTARHPPHPHPLAPHVPCELSICPNVPCVESSHDGFKLLEIHSLPPNTKQSRALSWPAKSVLVFSWRGDAACATQGSPLVLLSSYLSIQPDLLKSVEYAVSKL